MRRSKSPLAPLIIIVQCTLFCNNVQEFRIWSMAVTTLEDLQEVGMSFL